MATGGHGPNLAPVPGPVELVFVSERASAIIQCEYNSCNCDYLGTDQKMIQYHVTSILFHEVHVQCRI